MDAKRTMSWSVAAGAAGVALLFLAVTVQKVWSADTGALLAIGRLVVGQRAIPFTETFSYTAAGRHWIELHWLFCVPMYLVWEWVGPWTLSVVQSLMLAGMVWLIVGRGWRAAVHPVGLAVIALGLVAGMSRWVMRPELLTYLLIPGYLAVLEQISRSAEQQSSRFEQEKGRRWWWAWGLVVAQVVWVNAHPLSVFGPILAWTMVGGAGVRAVLGHVPTFAHAHIVTSAQRWRVVWRLSALAIGISAACWVNPYFHQGAMFPFQLYAVASKGSAVAGHITELQSIFARPIAMWSWDFHAALIFAGLVAVTFVLNWRRTDAARVVIFAAALFLAAGASRNVGLLAVMGMWVGVRNVIDWRETVDAKPAQESAAGLWMDSARAVSRVLIGAASGVFAWDVATDNFSNRFGGVRETGLGFVERNAAKAAADFVERETPSGRLYNAMADGGYLVWRLGGRMPVYVDGRTEVYGEEFWRLYFAGTEPWPTTAEKWGVNTVVLPREGWEPLIESLWRDAGRWALVHLDSRNFVFVREIPEHAGIIARHRITPAKAWERPAVEPDERPEAWKRALGGRGTAWHSRGMAAGLMLIDKVEEAGVYLERGLKEVPEDSRMSAMLAVVRGMQGRAEEMAALRAAATREDRAWADRRLVRALVASGRGVEAVSVIERMLAEEPEDAGLRLMLARERLRAGDAGAARVEYERGLKGGGGSFEDWNNYGLLCEQAGEEAAAVEAYRRSLELRPEQATIRNQLGILHAKRGELAEAEACFVEALRIQPGYTSAINNLNYVRSLK